MRVPEQVMTEYVRQWIYKAELDYRTAARLVGEPEFREAVAFHCQQAAEKYIKAFLTVRQIEFPKTHRLRLLLDLMARAAPELAASLEDLDLLSPYGVEMRYPSDFPEVLPGQERELLALAARARDAIRAELGELLGGG